MAEDFALPIFLKAVLRISFRFGSTVCWGKYTATVDHLGETKVTLHVKNRAERLLLEEMFHLLLVVFFVISPHYVHLKARRV